MPLAAGHRIGPFEIVAPLGAGGMGEVYRARDTRLGRDVALKSLPPGYASDPDRMARFEREARLLAALSHPNVAGIHGLEDAGGTPYLVLEIVEGETLAQRLTRGLMPVREVLEVGAQIAAAIEAAHERGIVHRDLKPGNVMISASRIVKVLDFGLARDGALEAASSSDLSVSPTMALSATGTGVILGTAPYMSPEQARGLRVDRRADVWAFGCILYECLSGRQCFAGETVSDVIARILEREPDWNALPPATPKRLTDLVRRCLTKDLDERPRDIGDLKRELSAIAQEMSAPSGISVAATGTPSLAVLYFENLAKDPDSEYFCAGITEDILTDLSKIKGLRVSSRNAVSRYRGAPVEIAKVAADLGVKAVLEGSVRRAGERVRISAQLINAADGFHLWAERYDRKLDDVFAVQEEIASSIAEALRVTLSPAETAALAKDKPQDVRAYDLYLKGREHYGRYNEAALREALALFQKATEIDPGYALAWAGIADCYGQLCQWGKSPDVADLTRHGLEAARHAISLDPRLPEAHKAEALNLKFAGDSAGSRAALERAVDVNPRFTPAILNLAVDSLCHGDFAGTERYVRRALQVDPQEAFATVWLGWLSTMSGRPEEALAAGQRLRRLTNAPWYTTAVYFFEAMVHLQRGEPAAAEQCARDGLAHGALGPDMQAIDAAAWARSGRMDDARRLLAQLDPGVGLAAGSLQLAAGAALRAGDRQLAARFLSREIIGDLGNAVARLDPELHGLLDLPPFAPRRWNVTLTWPLEAPMIDAACFPLFKEVRIESGRPPASDIIGG
jgi:serine/threonine protein kinase/Tfp pilus assembly protein PilF